MNIEAADKLCSSNGATLLHYKWPGVASVVLRSREQVVISIGTTSAKIFARRALLGWLAPKSCATRSLMEWEPRYAKFSDFHRNLCRGTVLDGLLDLVSRADSIKELKLSWHNIRNPLQVAAVATFEKMFPQTRTPDEETKTTPTDPC
jgi:hypothetical protein